MAGINIPELGLGSWPLTEIKYSFLTSYPNYQTAMNPVIPFTTAEKNLTQFMLTYISSVINVTFTEVTQDNSTNTIGDITFARRLQPDPGLTVAPSTGMPMPGVAGDIYLSSTLSGTIFWFTLLHELGHALGMKHPSTYAQPFPQPPPYLPFDEDNLSFTVMSERRGDTLPLPNTFMVYDIAHLQSIYGAAASFTNNDVYTYGTAEVRETIYDSNGTDTLSAAPAAKGAFINLNESKFSSISNSSNYNPGFPAKNIGIARDVTIEKAVGSAHADIVIGNRVGNNINAGAGDDSIFGDEVIAKDKISASSQYRNWSIDGEFWFKGQYQIDGTTDDDDNDVIFGEAGKDHIYGGRGDDALFGGTEDDEITGGPGNDYIDGGAGFDIARYNDGGGVPEIKILGDAQPPSGTTPDGEGPFYTAKRGEETDVLHLIESIDLGDGTTRVLFDRGTGTWQRAFFEIDGGGSTGDPGGSGFAALSEGEGESDSGDILDFSISTQPVFVGTAVTTLSNPEVATHAVEVFANFSPVVQFGQWVMNLFVSSGEPTGSGMIDPLGVRFTDFEQVIGSSGNDRLGLWWLNPGGELSAEDEAAFKAAKELPVSFASGDPATIAAQFEARVTAAAEISQNQQEVLIEGGAGDDVIVGTRTGEDSIYGGDGVDKLYAGGFTSELYGEAGTDYLAGGGLKSLLYGGEGADLFGLSSHTFVMDATSEDFVTWGPFHLTGGVAQWWTEGNWAYWTPFTSLISGAPLPFLNVFGALAVILDVAAASAFRYSVTQGGQLVVQAGFGRLAQAVINNYEMDPDTGKATGHVVVLKQVMGEGGSLEDFKKYLNLALKAGFGTGITGTDPLILDLDGDGLELTRRDYGNVYFNLDNDGFRRADRVGARRRRPAGARPQRQRHDRQYRRAVRRRGDAPVSRRSRARLQRRRQDRAQPMRRSARCASGATSTATASRMPANSRRLLRPASRKSRSPRARRPKARARQHHPGRSAPSPAPTAAPRRSRTCCSRATRRIRAISAIARSRRPPPRCRS